MNALEVQGLRKRYGDVLAVDGIDFTVERGETFGILGPNGAGKTTTLEIIEGIRAPDAGSVTLDGLDALRETRAVHERIGVQPQSSALIEHLTVEETLEIFAALYPRRASIDRLIDRLELGEKRRTVVEHLSGGQRQRLSVVVALVNDPQIVFLDEPTTGLDPQARHSVWEMVREMQAEDRTVILTTHYMEEAEELCGRVAIMDYGRIIALDTPKALVRSLDFENTIECSLDGGVGEEDLRALPAVRGVRAQDGFYYLFTTDVAATLSSLMAVASRGEVGVRQLQVHTATLEDVFLAFTGRRLRE